MSAESPVEMLRGALLAISSGCPDPADVARRTLEDEHAKRVDFRDPRRSATMPERNPLAELHDEQCAHAATMDQLDAALKLIRELRANHRRPFGGWAPYDLPARVDDFLGRVTGYEDA